MVTNPQKNKKDGTKNGWNGKKKLYFVKTNADDMIVSVDSDGNCRILYDSNECPLPYLCGLDEEEQEKVAIDFLNTVEDDSSWDDGFTYDELFNDESMCSYSNPDGFEIIAEIEKEF